MPHIPVFQVAVDKYQKGPSTSIIPSIKGFVQVVKNKAIRGGMLHGRGPYASGTPVWVVLYDSKGTLARAVLHPRIWGVPRAS